MQVHKVKGNFTVVCCLCRKTSFSTIVSGFGRESIQLTQCFAESRTGIKETRGLINNVILLAEGLQVAPALYTLGKGLKYKRS